MQSELADASYYARTHSFANSRLLKSIPSSMPDLLVDFETYRKLHLI